MKRKKGIIRSEQGFTLVEVIAVLILLGILAAVAAPKFISLEDAARVKAASAGIAEAKATLSMAYGKAYLIKGSQPTLEQVLAQTGFSDNIGNDKSVAFGDVTVRITKVDDKQLKIVGIKVGDTDVLPTDPDAIKQVTGYWDVPSNE